VALHNPPRGGKGLTPFVQNCLGLSMQTMMRTCMLAWLSIRMNHRSQGIVLFRSRDRRYDLSTI